MTSAMPTPCDAACALAVPPAGASAAPAGTLAAAVLGSSLVFIDGSVVTVALPAIQQDLGIHSLQLPWLLNAYLLPLGALILLGGGAGDRFGRRRLFVIGLVTFTLATLGCAAAPTFGLLVATRTLQGIGAALLLPNSLAMVGAAYPVATRGRAIGTWAGVGAMASAIGPVLGGWLIDEASWRVIFLINVPVAAAATYLAVYFVAGHRPAAPITLDWWGAAVIALGLFLLTLLLMRLGSGDYGRGTLVIALAASVALIGFVGIEARLRSAALVPLPLFARRTFVGLTLLTFFLYVAFGGLLTLLPFLMIRAGGMTAGQAGAGMLPVPIVISVVAKLGGAAGRISARWALTSGAAVVAVGCAWLSRTGSVLSYGRDILPPMLLVGIGMGLCVAPLTTAVLASVDIRHVGAASGFNSAVARVAGLVAAASLGPVFAMQGSSAGFVHGFNVASAAAAGCAGIAALAANALLRQPPSDANHARRLAS